MEVYSVDLKAQFEEISQLGECSLKFYIRSVDGMTGRIEKRPAIIVVGGGGYGFVSSRSQEPVSMKFLAKGYNVFELNYSVFPKTFPVQHLQLAAAVLYIKRNCEKLFVDKDKIATIGFSAGGHLTSSYSSIFSSFAQHFNEKEENLKVNANVASYAVITYPDFAENVTFERISGEDEKLACNLSCEKLVNEKTCPTFIWATATDELVPAENSLMYALSLSKHKIPYELHIFPSGIHGASVCEFDIDEEGADSCVSKYNSAWLELCFKFLSKYLNFDPLEKDCQNHIE